MTRILAIANQKGGVGKSTETVHIARYAADFEQKRVLVVDLDPQANTSGCFLSASYGLAASALFDEAPAVGSPTVISERLHIIPADKALADVEEMPMDIIARPREQLRRFDYDLIVIDTPPTLGRRLMAALVAADAVLTPFVMDKFSLDGMADLFETIQSIRSHYNADLVHLGILPNKYNSRSASQKAALNELREALGDMVLPHVITERVSISDALAAGNPVWATKKGGESARLAAAELKAACADIYQRVMI